MKTASALASLLISGALAGCGSSQDSLTTDTHAKQLTRSEKATGTAPSDYENVTQALYVAYFGRPADPAGEANYEAALLAAEAPTDVFGLSAAYATNPKIQTLIDSFGKSAESQSLYGTGTTTQFVTAIYQNVLGRAPEQDGLNFWVGAISSGQLTQGNAALSIMAGAEGNTTPQGLLDAQLVNNRLAVAETFTDTVTSMSAVKAYSGAGAAANARTMLASVTASTVTSSYQAQVTASVQYSIETQAAIDTINAARVSAGLPALNKVGALAIAAQEHANYMALNNTVGLEEYSSNPGFTYGDTSTRLTQAGYGSPDGNDEDQSMSAPNGTSIVGTGASQANAWLGSPVLRNAFFATLNSDIGVGLTMGTGANSTLSYNDILLGWKETAPTQPASFVAVYPAAGATNVPLVSSMDSYAFPGYTYNDFQTKTSYPISVAVPTTATIRTASLTVTAAGSATPLTMTQFSSANNTELEGWYMAYVGTAPFAPSTIYTAKLSATTSTGTVINLTWSFTTGS